MTRQNTNSQRRGFLVGAAVFGLALILLSGKLGGPAAQWISLLCAAARVGFELLPSIIPSAWQALEASVFHPQRISMCPFQLLVSFWPLLHVIA
jgi:hypothetical protein